MAPALSALGVPVGEGERDGRIDAAVFADAGETGVGVGVGRAVDAGIALAGGTRGRAGVALARSTGAPAGLLARYHATNPATTHITIVTAITAALFQRLFKRFLEGQPAHQRRTCREWQSLQTASLCSALWFPYLTKKAT
ncbi:MAG TPA: hypothetical protein VFE17_05265 [Candidatus Baltobacteraceae bacterium]|nr:hypothetical protein [Candidatus Baltobacteraceae bacterium]